MNQRDGGVRACVCVFLSLAAITRVLQTERLLGRSGDCGQVVLGPSVANNWSERAPGFLSCFIRMLILSGLCPCDLNYIAHGPHFLVPITLKLMIPT